MFYGDNSESEPGENPWANNTIYFYNYEFVMSFNKGLILASVCIILRRLY